MPDGICNIHCGHCHSDRGFEPHLVLLIDSQHRPLHRSIPHIRGLTEPSTRLVGSLQPPMFLRRFSFRFLCLIGSSLVHPHREPWICLSPLSLWAVRFRRTHDLSFSVSSTNETASDFRSTHLQQDCPLYPKRAMLFSKR
jgi:hypothetical protein